ncbi:MAG: hypothetical protein WD225_10205 [Ilumatobacteraceae bacterium]
MRVRALALGVALVAVGACAADDPAATDDARSTTTTSGSTTSTTTTPATTTTATTTTTSVPSTTTTTTEPPIAATRFDQPGPHPVGVTTLQLSGGIDVEVWYPAVEGTTGTVSYDVRDFTPELVRALLEGDEGTEGDVDASYSFEGERDAEAADAEFPVVLFSHGASGMRLQSSFLTSHLATHGMVVAAPDHPSRDLMNALGGRDESDPTASSDSVDDLLGTLELIVSAAADPDGPLGGRVDATRVAALGHSAGGGTVLRAAHDERIGSYVSMAAGGPDDPADYPEVPSLFMAGTVDEIVPPDDRTRPAFETAPPPAWYLEIAGTGHNGFDDFCTFGGGTGIIGVAEQAGLGPVLDAQPELRRLGEDGCIPPAEPVDRAFPIIQHATIAFLRWTFGLDDEVVGLDGDTLGEFELTTVADHTTVEQR